MPTYEFTCEVDAPLETVWAFHDTIDTLFRLTPPHTKARLDGPAVPMRTGVVYRLRMKRWGIPLPAWDAEIVTYCPPNCFVDRQVIGRGPFKYWEHHHLFEALSPGRTRIIDRVTYEMPFGFLGRWVDRLFVRRDIAAMFAYRHQITRDALSGKEDHESERASIKTGDDGSLRQPGRVPASHQGD
jgi:ligand-binding SRPBCC domain-containing protein